MVFPLLSRMRRLNATFSRLSPAMFTPRRRSPPLRFIFTEPPIAPMMVESVSLIPFQHALPAPPMLANACYSTGGDNTVASVVAGSPNKKGFTVVFDVAGRRGSNQR
jgi:hypothetical protein